MSASMLAGALAWWCTLAGVGMNVFDMTRMPSLIFYEASGAAARQSWDLQRFTVMLTMWWMMMLPSAAPVNLLAAALN